MLHCYELENNKKSTPPPGKIDTTRSEHPTSISVNVWGRVCMVAFDALHSQVANQHPGMVWGKMIHKYKYVQKGPMLLVNLGSIPEEGKYWL